MEPPSQPPSRLRSRLLLLVAAALCVCFARLSSAPIWILNEAREGIYARAMLASGDFVLPVVENHVENGVTIPDKPPLLHWIDCSERWVRSLLSGQDTSGPALARAFDVFDLRFASALAAIVCVLGVFLLGRSLVGERAAWLAGFVLLASAQFEHQSHFGRVDMCLAACVACATLLLGQALVHGSRRALLGAAVFSALAVLSKGPLGLVLPATAGASYLAWRSLRERGLSWAPRLPWVRAALVWALVALPWYLVAWRQGGSDFVHSQLLNENVAQFGGGNGRMSWSTYVGPWLTDTFPWNLIALFGLWRARRGGGEGARFASAWWLSLLLLFQLAAYKRRAYLLPAVPAEALLAGFALDGWLLRARELEARWGRLALATAAGACLGALAGGWLRSQGHALRVSHVELVPTEQFVGCASLGALLGALTVLVLGLRERRPLAALAALFVACIAGVSGAVPIERSARARAARIPELVRSVEHELPPGAAVTLVGLGNDPSMVLLFEAREPGRWHVVPDADPLPRHFPRGWYLATTSVAQPLLAQSSDGCGSWREVWRARLSERDNPRDVVLLERLGPQRMSSR
ncbi:MAG: glycosyltransferase family 39 protein [Planctomycetes bacterium]|nr:glycosyltransferase family 39 protein [Planctomycetota bacterium]